MLDCGEFQWILSSAVAVVLDSHVPFVRKRDFFPPPLRLSLDRKLSELSEGSLFDLTVDAFLIISETFWCWATSAFCALERK